MLNILDEFYLAKENGKKNRNKISAIAYSRIKLTLFIATRIHVDKARNRKKKTSTRDGRRRWRQLNWFHVATIYIYDKVNVLLLCTAQEKERKKHRKKNKNRTNPIADHRKMLPRNSETKPRISEKGKEEKYVAQKRLKYPVWVCSLRFVCNDDKCNAKMHNET